MEAVALAVGLVVLGGALHGVAMVARRQIWAWRIASIPAQ